MIKNTKYFLFLLLFFPLILAAQDYKKDEAFDICIAFIEELEEGNYEAAVELCHPEAFEFDPKDVWIDFFYGMEESIGKIEATSLYNNTYEYGEGEAGEGYYYEFFFETEYRDGDILYEKIVVFHRTLEEEPQILGFFYNQNKDGF